MTVFKNYLKIAKSYLGVIVFYIALFMVFAIITTTSGSQTTTDYSSVKANVAIVYEGKENALIDSFIDYVKETSELVEIDIDEEALKDALFYRQVDYIMIIPPDFTEAFMNQENPQIEVMVVPNSTASIYSKQLMNQYFNIASLYLKADIAIEDLVLNIKEDLSKKAEVTLANINADEDLSKLSYYYNFSNYTIIATMISVISMIILVFNEEKIRNRNLISPFSYKKINRQLFLGNATLAFLIWIVYVGVSYILYHDLMMSQYGILLIINSFIFTLTILTLSFLLTTITNNRNTIGQLSTILALGTSFIAGAFVPQELLGNAVLNLSKVTPSYWFIKNNNIIIKLIDINTNTLKPYYINLFIMLMFTLGFYVCIQILGKLKLKK